MIIGSNILFFNNLPSSNSHAASLIKKKELPEGTIIRTNFQSAGRGYGGNKWESEENKNLLISIVLFPVMISPTEQFIISMAVSLGICDFLDHYTSDISIKWPNDIYVKNDKIAGILIENSIMGNLIEHTIAGIGININQEKFLSEAPNPVSLTNLTGKQYELRNCLNKLASDLDKRYKCLISGDFDLLKNDYHSRLFRHNKWCKYHDMKGIFRGRIVNVSETGRLKVEMEDGMVNEYSFKEIEFVL
jgi:BirA family transcriptional regulator, biotin operon repressor / biotin---[acetyl-CoA-carboxylase] ligase